MKLYIRNMVCIRCKMIVEQELKRLFLHGIIVELGEIEILENATAVQLEQLNTALLKYDLELMDCRKSILIEKIKKVIVEMVHYIDDPEKINFSNYLSKKLNHNYTYLANLFSETVGITIEQYIISHKIERVKELLFYDELSLTEISYKMHYSSVAHLSNQFKKTTGLTPSHFKKFGTHRFEGIVTP
ncbi:helix-turn-helix domain-containing protein [Pedobacter arcticus]|uniref:helix-turn-helix domain-containing protein n=1 Tax=Pedobacter arcticus TaxID=752140 RepID=UPI0004744B05|nr:helix-turn-helix transcriptional regulator [Pedobacter arcticus]